MGGKFSWFKVDVYVPRRDSGYFRAGQVGSELLHMQRNMLVEHPGIR